MNTLEDSVEINLNQATTNNSTKNSYNISNFTDNQITCANTCKQYFKSKRKKFTKSGFLKDIILKRIPITEWLPKYNVKTNLFPDLISGNTVGVMNIPQGMAYSLLGKFVKNRLNFV